MSDIAAYRDKIIGTHAAIVYASNCVSVVCVECSSREAASVLENFATMQPST